MNPQFDMKRGALHFHVAVRGRQNYHLLRSIWQSVLGLGQSGEQMGQVNVRDPHRFGFGKNGAHKLASYIAQYCGKGMDCRELDQKRYFRSRGIVLPVVNTWRLGNSSGTQNGIFFLCSSQSFTVLSERFRCFASCLIVRPWA